MRLLATLAAVCALTLLACWLGVRYLWDASPPYPWLCDCPGWNPADRLATHHSRRECRGRSVHP